jgi:ribosomal protein S18 acetylase RimI-like enzyme
MFLVRKARITDLNIIRCAISGVNCDRHNFYSDPIKNVILHMIRRSCYIILKRGIVHGVVILKDTSKEVLYYPCLEKGISFPSLLFVLRKNLKLTGYQLLLNYKNIDIRTVKEYFRIKLLSDFKYMYLRLGKSLSFERINNMEYKVRKAILDVDEGIRVILQNGIFSEVRGRKELTIDEVLNEEKDPKFISDLCFILEINNDPAGYGQILCIEGRNVLVNFGIIPEYRGKGYSKIFLEDIISHCISYGVEELYLSVDNSNVKALGLYKSMGFDQLHNIASIEI